MTVAIKLIPKEKDINLEDLDSVCIQGTTFYRNEGSSDENAVAQATNVHLRSLLDIAQGYREKYNWLCNMIKEEQKTAQDNLNSLKDQGLSFGSILAEGELRSWNSATDLIVYVDKNS